MDDQSTVKDVTLCCMVVSVPSAGGVGTPQTCPPPPAPSSFTLPKPIDTEPPPVPVNSPRSSWTVMRRGGVPSRTEPTAPDLGWGCYSQRSLAFILVAVVFITTEPVSSPSCLSLSPSRSLPSSVFPLFRLSSGLYVSFP
ncbi:unnamed protein product [Pleuronectes platessa]|uniref:Uncharacterized protein n=1 Tax=Pleuronectes platessa TaxID=8262 RepID=A0A9N7YHV1_PLEPL|nr:unnamed protein product [Pleuronectes platessa]